jgi:hypothetical protein
MKRPQSSQRKRQWLQGERKLIEVLMLYVLLCCRYATLRPTGEILLLPFPLLEGTGRELIQEDPLMKADLDEADPELSTLPTAPLKDLREMCPNHIPIPGGGGFHTPWAVVVVETEEIHGREGDPRVSEDLITVILCDQVFDQGPPEEKVRVLHPEVPETLSFIKGEPEHMPVVRAGEGDPGELFKLSGATGSPHPGHITSLLEDIVNGLVVGGANIDDRLSEPFLDLLRETVVVGVFGGASVTVDHENLVGGGVERDGFLSGHR